MAPAAAASGSKTLIIVAVVVVVVVIAAAVGALALAGVGPFAKSSPSNSSGGTGETFDDALTTAQDSANNQPSGPWTFFVGSGIQLTTSASYSTSSLLSELSLSGCTPSLLSGIGSTLTIPSTTISVTSGDSAAWFFFFIGSGGGLYIGVFGGSATPLVRLAGSSCFSELTAAGITATFPSDHADSPAIAAAASAAGASAFASSHSSVDVEMSVSSGFSYDGTSILQSSWNYTVTTCNEASTTGGSLNGEAAAQFSATVNTTTAAVVGSGHTTADACTAAAPGGSGTGSGSSGSGTVPSAPTDLVATAVTSSVIDLSWTNPTGTLLNGTVYQGTTCGSWTKATGISVQTTYAATGLSADTGYCFAVTVWDSTGQSAESNTASATTEVGGGGGGGGGQGETFSQALAKANSSLASAAGAPWEFLLSVGWQSGTSGTIPTANLTAEANSTGCTGTLQPGVGSTITLPSTTVAATSGTTNSWVFDYANATDLMIVFVFGGTATPTMLVSGAPGSDCASPLSISGFNLTFPSTYANSPAAATAAYDFDGEGADFTANHSAYDVAYEFRTQISDTVLGHRVTLAANWTVDLSTCDVAAANGSTLDDEAPAQLNVSVNGTSGVATSYALHSYGCPTGWFTSGSGNTTTNTTPTFNESAVLFFSAQTHAGSKYWNNATFYYFGNGTLYLGNFTAEIVNSSTLLPISSESSDTLKFYDNTTGTNLATYDFLSTPGAWNHPDVAAGNLSEDDIFEIISDASLAGDALLLTATSGSPITGYLSADMGLP